MRIGPRMGMIVLGLMTTTAAAPSANRLVIVVSLLSDRRATQQHMWLEQDTEMMLTRDVVVLDLTPDAARRDRPELGVGSKVDFQVLLVGKDGGVKLRSDKPIASSKITDLIDTMPMRQIEIRR